jgi:cytoskeletal protein RodZ
MEDDLSVYDEEESLFGDNASVDDSEAGSLIGAREDVKLMNVVRAIVILILLTIAFISAETVFVIATISEQDQFRDAYSDATGKLVEGFLADLNTKLLTARSFSTELSSSAKDMSWPNVSFDDFEVRSGAPLRMSKSSVISFSPIVMADESDAWESYAASVYDTSVATQRALVSASPHLANVSSGVAYYPTNRVVGDGIYAFNGTKAVDKQALYSLPIWQMCPTFGNGTTGLIGTLFDQASNNVREQALDLMFVRGGCSMSTFLYQDTNGTDYANYSLPRSVINYPVYKNLTAIGVGGEPAGDIGASLNFEFRWEPVLSGILFDYNAPLTVVVQNECGEAFTYTVSGAKAVYVGQGAIYDKSVDGYTPANTSYAGFDVLFAAHGGASIAAENSCSYKLSVYATSAFKKAYLGQNPGLYKGIVLGFFLVLVLIFIGFDCMIDRSTKHVIQAAERSDKIVRSLFPEAIRDRLYEDAIRKEQQQRTDKNHWKNDGSTVVAAKHKLKTLLDEENPDSDDVGNHDTEPIADFFPNCTVLFADLAGFTAWSSEREPTQVFTLLEQIYRVMDKVAKKLKVFKVRKSRSTSSTRNCSYDPG